MNRPDPQRDRLPPHSVEGEQGILGCVLLDGTALGDCLEHLRDPLAFYDLRHREIFLAMRALWEKSVPIDVLTLSEQLRTAGQLEASGGLGYLSTLPETVPSAANLPSYVAIVREKYLLRRMLQTCSDAARRIFEAEGNAETILDEVERDLMRVNEARVSANEVELGAALEKVMEQIENYRRGAVQLCGLATGFRYLDAMLLGLSAGDMIVIAARPGMGKTSIGVQIAEHVATEQKVPVAIFTLEMTAHQLAARLLFQRARADFQRFRTGFSPSEDIPEVMAAYQTLRSSPLLLDETSAIGILELRARARRLQRQYAIGLIVVDYLQLMRGARWNYSSREQEVAEISRGLKALAKELRIPVIVLCQLNRELERGGHRRPQLSDLRESGAIEQDADVVLMLYEPKAEKNTPLLEDWSDHSRKINVFVAKQRNGPTGDCNLVYRKAPMRFDDPYAHEAPPGLDLQTPASAPEDDRPGPDEGAITAEDANW